MMIMTGDDDDEKNTTNTKCVDPTTHLETNC